MGNVQELRVLEERFLNEDMTVNELLMLAKEYNIVGRHKMAKPTLRTKIAHVMLARVNETLKAEEKSVAPIKDEVCQQPKLSYITTAVPGSIVAFNDCKSNRMRSAKVVETDPVNKTMKLETEYGMIFNVRYEDITWVRTTNRWPRGIYNALKGRN